MTNILATIVVCIVTNVTTTDNAVFVPNVNMSSTTIDCASDSMLLADGLWHDEQQNSSVQGHMSEPTERTETTEIVEVKRLSFKWEGKDWNGEVKKVLSSSSRKFKLKKQETWEEVTNAGQHAREHHVCLSRLSHEAGWSL